MSRSSNIKILAIIGPGILVAATGVGGGDIATGAFSGSMLGTAILWAAVLGAAMKFVLTEGLARWQLATGDTLLEGCVQHFGRGVQFLFLAYLLLWSLFVGSALMSSCGVAAHAIFPWVLPEPITWNARTDEPPTATDTRSAADPQSSRNPAVSNVPPPPVIVSGKIFFGLVHSVLAVVLVLWGGYRLFEKIMSACIAVMFVTVIVTALIVRPDWGTVASGIFVPYLPQHEEGVQWTIALIGGVGGTLTVICYGYWIREEGREGTDQLAICRIDLATGYMMTAMFGVGMIVIGSRIHVDQTGGDVIVQLANRLHDDLGRLGTTAKWAFLVGAWGAVFSSLLGVWQSVPYIFTDFWNLARNKRTATGKIPVDPKSLPYRAYLFCLATIPAVGLWISFVRVQKYYAILGAAFVPMLALALLILNGRAKWVGSRHRNSLLTSAVLVFTLLFFLAAAWIEIRAQFFS